MASIVLEVLEHSGAEIEVEIIPGVTAANAAASRVGSPLSGDFAVISLSDLLTPLEIIEKRLEAIFSIGIPVVLYNPKSRGRPHNFAIAVGHARNHLGNGTPIAIVKNADQSLTLGPEFMKLIHYVLNVDCLCKDSSPQPG